MKTSKPWVKALNVKFQDYESWTTQLSEGHSITFWALDHGKLRTQDYLYWAREHYQLPVVKDGYFRDQANSALYQQMKSVANWSEEMIPLEQWDSVIYIACVEPPEGVNWSFPVRYVLASARSLKTVWQKFQQQPSMAPQPQPVSQQEAIAPPPVATAEPVAPPPVEQTEPVAPPPVIATAPATPPAPPQQPEASATVTETSEQAPVVPPPPANVEVSASDDQSTRQPTRTSIDVPEGMEFGATVTNAQQEAPEGVSFTDPAAEATEPLELSDTPADAHSEMPEGMTTEAPEMPEGISLDLTDAPEIPEGMSAEAPEMPEGMGVEATEMPEGISAEAPPEGIVFAEPEVSAQEDPTVPNDIPAPAQATATEDETYAPTEEPTAPVAQPTPEPAVAAGPAEPSDLVFEDVEEEDTGLENTRTQFGLTVSGVNQIAPAEAVVDLDRDLPASLDAATDEKQAVAWAFNELKQCFSQSMILLFEDKNVKPWKWESIWTPSDEKSLEAFSADKPGVFRIVSRTKQPYHGFIVESPANKEFFEQWGFIEMPKHATVIPLDFDGHVVGVVLAVGEETSGTDSNLMIAERTVATLTEQLKAYFSNAA